MKKASIIVILITILLASCKRETPVEAPSPPEDVRVPATCTDSASFVADVTIPDNTNLDPGKTFIKTWRIKNTGTCTWDKTYSLVFALNERMDAPDAVPLEKTRPGREVDISVELTTPAESGEYRADFQLLNADGVAMPIDNGEYIWVIITIGPAVGWSDSSAGDSNTWADGPGLADITCEYATDPAKTAEILVAIQAYRAQNDLPELTLNAQLEQAAQAHANDMACNKVFVHTGSNGSSPGTRVSAVGYSASKVGENVYGSYLLLSGQDVVAWWATDQNDIRHNENLVSTDYTEIGVGYAFFDNFGHYAVVFAAP
jgi:uncharacterized protein YkwD